ncbi:MAG: hypothetical protein AB1679_24775 [Actinomycetota bacterium]
MSGRHQRVQATLFHHRAAVGTVASADGPSGRGRSTCRRSRQEAAVRILRPGLDWFGTDPLADARQGYESVYAEGLVTGPKPRWPTLSTTVPCWPSRPPIPTLPTGVAGQRHGTV